MKIINFLLLFMISSGLCFSASANGRASSYGKDSVGVFHRPDKVIILVTERGLTSRLAQFMNLWNPSLNITQNPEAIIWQSPDQELTIRCFKNYDEHSCTFKLLPTSTFVEIHVAQATLVDYPLSGLGTVQDFEMEFKSSRDDHFRLVSTKDKITLEATKRHPRSRP